MVAALKYQVYVSAMQALPTTAGIHLPDGQPAFWSPMASTLIVGPTEAVLTDPPVTIQQATKLATWVASFGRPLTAIYITHGHGDHWFGAKTVQASFPTAKVYATPAVIAQMQQSVTNVSTSQFWEASFPGQIGDTPILAQPVPVAGLAVDGHELRVVEVGHTDTDFSSVLHVPALDLVIAGDAIYHRVHQWLAESADDGIAAWLRAIDIIAGLAPTHIVAGHQDATRAEASALLQETREYLLTAAAVLADQPTRRTYFAEMLARFPHHLNPTIVWLSAIRLIPED